MPISDWRLAIRALRKSPGFTAAAILTLAFGAGVNTAMFTIIHALMLRPLPFPEPDRLAMLYVADNRPADELSSTINRRKMSADGLRVERWAQLSRSFECIGGYRFWRLSATGPGTVERLNAVIVLGDLFRVLGVKPAIGREFFKEEMQPQGARVAILGHAYWQRRFGGDPTVLGRSIELDGYPYTIVGVMPSGYAPVLPRIPRYADVWTTPMVDFTGSLNGPRRFTICQAIGRLKPGTTLAQAQAEMDAVSKSMEVENRRFWGRNVNVAAAREEVADNLRPALIVLFAAVGCVLLIACANIAGLALARQAARRRETAIRAVLGASRWSLIRKSLIESLLVSFAGGAVGLLLAYWLLAALALLSPIQFDKMADVRMDAPVLLFAFLLSLVTSLLFGLLPAISASRTDLNSAIKNAAAQPGGRGLLSLRHVLVASEVALAVTLLVGAGLLVRSFVLLRGVDTGFERRNVIAASLPLPETSYGTPARRQALVDALSERLRRVPGVDAVGFTNSMALAGSFMMSGDFTLADLPRPERPPQANLVAATPGYFLAAGIPLLAGRYFTDSESASGDAALVNEMAAKRYFGGSAQAIGHRISGGICKSCRIVGVVGNIRNFGLKNEAAAELYGPLAQLPCPTLDLVVRTHADPLPLVRAVSAEIAAAAPDIAVDRIRTMEDVLADHTAQPRFNAILLGLFAALALLLAAIGVFGVTAHWVAQRTREIGVRMALGAQRPNVLRMVLRQALLVGCVGVAAGAAGSFAAARLMGTLLFGVPTHDPVTFAGVSFAMLAVTAAAAWVPARRAARVDPMEALRHE